MKTFKIQYTSRYGETKESYTETIKAKTEIAALKQFCKLFDNVKYTDLKNDDFTWEDGCWTSKFKCITEIFPVTTADKRVHFLKENPELFNKVQDMIECSQYRELDALLQDIQDIQILQYCITWMADEMIVLDGIN